MHLVHGTWIPADTGEFIQDGTFALWVETDALVGRSRRTDRPPAHPRHLVDGGLQSFLAEKLNLDVFPGYPGARIPFPFVRKSFLLPSAGGAPLPSYELLPYSDQPIPPEWELAPWQVCCYPLSQPIADLNNIHFAALHGAEDFQLGADLLFWYQYAQELKRLIVADQYIPTLAYRPLAVQSPKEPAFELQPGWELCSEAYESTLRRYAACMPAACTTGADSLNGQELYAPETLLRHFSECMLHHVVTDMPTTAKFDQQIAGTLLADCLHPARPIRGSDDALETYKAWAGWRSELTAAQLQAGFTLCFWLEEAVTEDADHWQVHFVAASRRDPSLKVNLAEYWTLPAREKATLMRHLGADFERHLLLALGHAARVYPRVWDGLDTDRPSGFALTLAETYDFLKEYAWVLEDAGYTVVVPSWWTREGRRRAKVRLTTTTRSNGAGSGKTYFDLDTVVDYKYQLSIDGQVVSDAEWRQLVAAKTPLVQFRGQWMELDRERIQQMLALWNERKRDEPEMTLLDLMKTAADQDGDLEWEYDQTLEEVLDALREKSAPEQLDNPANFQGALREYQKRGVAWLRYLESLRLNPCLADDMGLGKTVQVIAQLVAERNERGAVPPTLLIAPTSVLGNWSKEVERFAPHLRVLLHHGPDRHKEAKPFQAACAESDVVITSFALARLDQKLLHTQKWRRIVVDEAQNIKNPQSAQTRAIAKLSAEHRLALTGTPVENRLRDLWSIFNFLNPGYLGKEPQFRKAFEIPIQKENDPVRSAALKRLVEPFILRRLKTDRQIIRDLPDKIEQKVYCNLTPEQASLYEAVVRDVEEELDSAEGIQRRGLILATLMKLKQICNHPAQFLHDGSIFASERSHKLERLTEMLEEVIAGGESALVFTQFTEAGEALERHIRRTLHCATYYLHGGTSATKREQMVAAFQDPESQPAVFVLSVRAGGTGLNLTKANHVFHFDRWWNPAVEDQATDRAFRIGQSKNVFAHKFVALGTVEERLDQMIEEKKQIAAAIVGSDESWLTELDNNTFKDLIALRRSAVLA